MAMATPILNSISTTRLSFVPYNSKPSRSSTKSLNNASMATNFTKFGARQGTCTRVRAPLPFTELTAKDEELKNQQVDGIGIVPFLRGKELLITGATGFLAKALVEKIIREVPDVGKIYLIIKSPTLEDAMQRLKNEVINTEVFKLLQQTYGDSYNTYMLSKLVPVIGNISDSYLGLDEGIATRIASKVDIIVNSAANTVFDERYDVALKINTNGPYNIIQFAKRCKQLKLFLHVSTAYVNGEREGKVLEKPFRMGDSIAREKHSQGQQPLPPMLDVQAELKFAFSQNSSTRKMKELGMTRAKQFGWQDTYVFTKAMGEIMIDAEKGDIPVTIIRPSIVESTLKEPFPGWIQGNRMVDPIIMNYGKGKLLGFPADPNSVVDIIPADMVANAILAAMARHGSAQELGNGVNVYHVGSSVANPLLLADMVTMWYECFNSDPYTDPKTGNPIKVSPLETFGSVEDFSSSIRQNAIQQIVDSSAKMGSFPCEKNLSPKQEKLLKRSTYQLECLANTYLPYTCYSGRFDISNTKRLMECMSEDEKNKFGFDIDSINWKDYFKNVHIPGLKRGDGPDEIVID